LTQRDANIARMLRCSWVLILCSVTAVAQNAQPDWSRVKMHWDAIVGLASPVSK